MLNIIYVVLTSPVSWFGAKPETAEHFSSTRAVFFKIDGGFTWIWASGGILHISRFYNLLEQYTNEKITVSDKVYDIKQ